MATFLSQLRRVRPRQWLGWGCVGVGLAGLVMATAYFPAVHPRAVGSKILTTSEPKPNAKQVAAYTVPAADPKYIAIPAISLGNTPVLAFGLAKDGSIATPNSIYETGWYNASGKPGQAGAMFIYGHIASFTKYSVFANLGKLKPGDTITITRGDNTLFHYQVTGSKTYPYNGVDMGTVLGSAGLNVMTCAGPIITVGGVKEYSQRLVVFAKPV